MPFLIVKNKDENILIDKAGENIYMRAYTLNNPQRTNVICKSIFNDYAVSYKNGKMQIVYRTSKNSVIHLSEGTNLFSKRTLLEDGENVYNICNLKLLCDKKNYLFYCALNPYEKTNDLIFHMFSNEEEKAPQALLSLPQLNSKYQCQIVDNKIYLMTSLHQEQKYELNMYIFNLENEQWEEFSTLFTSEYPITDFSFVMNTNEIDISYVVEKYGHYSLNYVKKTNDKITNSEIFSAGQKINTVIFIYNKVLWINYKIENTLYYSFSTDNGKTITDPIKCTVQNANIDNIQLIIDNQPSLLGKDYFGYIGKYPYVVVLSQIDVDKILFYSEENTELKKLLEVTFNENSDKSNNEEYINEIKYLRQVEQDMYDKYNELVKFTKEVQAEGKKWRKKYKRVEMENKRREEKMKLKQENSINKENVGIKEETQEKTNNVLKASEIDIDKLADDI
jgi:hypothetical protein